MIVFWWFGADIGAGHCGFGIEHHDNSVEGEL
jgi:hypothetical protein